MEICVFRFFFYVYFGFGRFGVCLWDLEKWTLAISGGLGRGIGLGIVRVEILVLGCSSKGGRSVGGWGFCSRFWDGSEFGGVVKSCGRFWW